MIVRVELSTMSDCIVCWDTVVISGEYAWCSVASSTLAGVSVFSVMWSELPMASAISCPPWS